MQPQNRVEFLSKYIEFNSIFELNQSRNVIDSTSKHVIDSFYWERLDFSV